MGSGITFKVRREEFDRTLRQYRKFSKRDVATIVNTKACFIARRAIIETPKADKQEIAKELGRVIKSGKNAGKLRLSKSSSRSGGPLVALIINARRGRAGLAGLYGAAMDQAARALLAARNRSIGFLKSGWIGAVKKLLPFADRGGPRQDRNVKEYGQPKGDATPAREGSWRVRATIENAAGDNRGNKGALEKYGGPALQRAFDAETASMIEYMEKKMRDGAREAGIKTN